MARKDQEGVGSTGMKSLRAFALLGAGVSGLLSFATIASADEAEHCLECPNYPWPHQCILSSYDHASLSRVIADLGVLWSTSHEQDSSWSPGVPTRNFLSHGADMLVNDDMWKEDGNIFRAEEDVAADCGMKRKRCRTQFRQVSLDLPSPQTKMLIKEFKHLSPCRSNKVSCLKSSRKTLEFDEHQVETGFACESNYSFQLHDRVLFPCRETVDQENGCHLETPDGKVSYVEDYFLENNFTTERSNVHVDRIIGTRSNDVSLKLDADMSDILASSGELSADCFEVNNNVEETSENLKEDKSFLQSCFSRRDLLFDRAFSASDKGFEFQINRFRNQGSGLAMLIVILS